LSQKEVFFTLFYLLSRVEIVKKEAFSAMISILIAQELKDGLLMK